MKFAVAFLVLAFVACTYAQEEKPALTPEQVIDIIQENEPNLACINLACRLSCRSQGFKAGYCNAEANCICTPPVVVA